MSASKSVPWKPVAHVTDAGGNSVDLSPPSASIRVVAQEDEDRVRRILEDDDLGYLAPALTRLDLGQPLHLHDPVSDPTPPQHASTQGLSISRRSLEKPVPDTPQDGHRPDCGAQQPQSYDPTALESSTERFYGKSTADLARDLGVAGILDLSNSEDTTVHTRYAPAVTHNTIQRDVHEIRHEEIHRVIHNHDVHHRILPIQHVEVLPAKHYIEDATGTRRQVSADLVPGRTPELTHALLTECFKDRLTRSDQPFGPRQFSAREFPGTTGDYRQCETTDGFLQTERWHVHPPTLGTGGQKTGQTTPFHLNDEPQQSHI